MRAQIIRKSTANQQKGGPPAMKKILFKGVNKKLIGGGGQKSNLTKLNNNVNKDYEITNRNISDFS